MLNLKYTLRNINLLNIILIAVIILLANYTILPLLNINIKYTLPAGKKITIDKDGPPAESHIQSPSDYIIIAEENPFHPERKIPVDRKDEQPLPKPEFVLYGTLITDNLRLAYIEDFKAPRSTIGRGKRQLALHQGNTLSGFTLSEIYHDRVLMVRGDEKIEVNITDSAHAKLRSAGELPIKEPAPNAPSSSNNKRPEMLKKQQEKLKKKK